MIPKLLRVYPIQYMVYGKYHCSVIYSVMIIIIIIIINKLHNIIVGVPVSCTYVLI